MLATAGGLPPEDGRWAYEVKWDGVRVLAAVEGERVTLHSRAGNPVTASYPELAALRSPVPVLLDGEVVAFDEAGRPDFGLLQSRMHVGRPPAELRAAVPVALLVFDVLHAGDSSLLQQAYDERRALLEHLDLRGAQVPGAFLEGGVALLDSTRVAGLEGVVAKRRDSRYEPGRRSEHWVKVKHVHRQSAVVIGWKAGDGGRSGQLGSLLLAVHGTAGLEYAGHVGSGFSAAELRRLGGLLGALAATQPPCEVPREHARVAHWVRPVLVAEVDFTGWTREGRLRQPSYQGLRDDLDPEQVVRE
ncbi:MAG: ligase [Frankiales bacterium]|nr:ligase [Frankiales bacterium]